MVQAKSRCPVRVPRAMDRPLRQRRLDGELKDKYGEQHLKAGETFQAGYTITIGE